MQRRKFTSARSKSGLDLPIPGCNRVPRRPRPWFCPPSAEGTPGLGTKRGRSSEGRRGRARGVGPRSGSTSPPCGHPGPVPAAPAQVQGIPLRFPGNGGGNPGQGRGCGGFAGTPRLLTGSATAGAAVSHPAHTPTQGCPVPGAHTQEHTQCPPLPASANLRALTPIYRHTLMVTDPQTAPHTHPSTPTPPQDTLALPSLLHRPGHPPSLAPIRRAPQPSRGCLVAPRSGGKRRKTKQPGGPGTAPALDTALAPGIAPVPAAGTAPCLCPGCGQPWAGSASSANTEQQVGEGGRARFLLTELPVLGRRDGSVPAPAVHPRLLIYTWMYMYNIHEQQCRKGLGAVHGGTGGDANPQALGDPREQRGFLSPTGDPQDRGALGGSPIRSIAERGRRMLPPAPGTGDRARPRRSPWC